MLNSITSLVNFVQISQKVISLVTMATNVDSKLLTIVFLFLSGTDHSVKISSNFESARGPIGIFWWLQRIDVKYSIFIEILIAMCRQSGDTWQSKNRASNGNRKPCFQRSTFVDSINVFDCRISGVKLLEIS